MIPYVYTGPSNVAFASGNVVFGGRTANGNLRLHVGNLTSASIANYMSAYPMIDSSMWVATSDLLVTYNGSILYSAHHESHEKQSAAIYAPTGSIVQMRIRVNPYNRTWMDIPTGWARFAYTHSAIISPYEFSGSGVLSGTGTVNASARWTQNTYYIWANFYRNTSNKYMQTTAVADGLFSTDDGNHYASYHQHSSESAFPTAYTDISGLSAKHFTFKPSPYPVYKVANASGAVRHDWLGYYKIDEGKSRWVSAFGSSYNDLGATGTGRYYFGPSIDSCVIADPNAPIVLTTNDNAYSGLPLSASAGSAQMRFIAP